MKKLFAILLTLCLCFGLVACDPESFTATDALSYLEEGLAALFSPEPKAETDYKEYRSHVFLLRRSKGVCDRLTGKVMLNVIFTDEPESRWTDGEMDAFKSGMDEATHLLNEDAAKYGAELEISCNFLRGKAIYNVDFDNYDAWSKDALKESDQPSLNRLVSELKKNHGVDEAPVFFAVNRDGRSFAVSSGENNGDEYAILYRTESDYRHETMHLFGSKDYYFPKEVQACAETYLPGSIMNTADGDTPQTMDPLTAYTVGWTETLTDEAKAFLNETAHFTEEDIEEAKEEETYTGYGERVEKEGTYTGELLNGIYHGQGKYVWNNGNVYEGGFEHGKLTGKGKFSWNNGDTYEGDVVDGTLHGQGKYVWANGSTYVGQYQNGQRNGTGKYTWTEGDVYEGEYLNNEIHGTGKYTWANGDVYEGTWTNGELTGYGTKTWTDGTTYTGWFLNGKLHGQGTCTYPSGAVRSGTWENSKFIG